MSQFDTRLEEHPYRTNVDSLFTRIEECKELEELSEHEFDTLHRIDEVYQIVQFRINSVDPMLLSKTTLDGISNNTNEVHSQLAAVIQNHNLNNVSQKMAHINRINELLDSVVIQITQIYQPLVPSEVEALRDSLVSTRQSLSQHNRYIKEEYERFGTDKQGIEEEIKEISSTLTSVETQVDTAVEKATDQLVDFERMFSEKQQERIEEFTDSLNAWETKFDDDFDDMKEIFSQKIKDVEEEFEKYKSRLDSRMEEHDIDVKGTKDELYSLIEVAGNDVMSDGYAKYANKAAINKLVWQVVSVVSLIGLVSAAYSIIPSLEQEKFSWVTLAARSLLTVSIAALTGFTIRQAHLAHLEEQQSREMQLKLGSIEPYLKNFPLEKRNEIKEKLVVDYFSKERTQYNNTLNQKDPLPSTQQVEQTTA